MLQQQQQQQEEVEPEVEPQSHTQEEEEEQKWMSVNPACPLFLLHINRPRLPRQCHSPKLQSVRREADNIPHAQPLNLQEKKKKKKKPLQNPPERAQLKRPSALAGLQYDKTSSEVKEHVRKNKLFIE